MWMTEMSVGLGFQDPPAKREPKYDWSAIADMCRQRPRRWYLVFESDNTSQVVAINTGSVKELHPDLGFVTRTANNMKGPPRICDFYLMYDPDRDTTRSED